jgi:hypothetical protein
MSLRVEIEYSQHGGKSIVRIKGELLTISSDIIVRDGAEFKNKLMGSHGLFLTCENKHQSVL